MSFSEMHQDTIMALAAGHLVLPRWERYILLHDGVKNQAPQRNSVFLDACCVQMVCLIYQILHKCKCLVCTTTHVSSVP